MGILTTPASVQPEGSTSAVSPTDVAEAFPGALSWLNDDVPSSEWLDFFSFFFNFSLLGLAVRLAG